MGNVLSWNNRQVERKKKKYKCLKKCSFPSVSILSLNQNLNINVLKEEKK